MIAVSEVLRAIVADFVATKEPIGSKALVERHHLGVSSATVRNDMAVLEAEATSPSRTPVPGGAHREGLPGVRQPDPTSSRFRPRSAGPS